MLNMSIETGSPSTAKLGEHVDEVSQALSPGYIKTATNLADQIARKGDVMANLRYLQSTKEAAAGLAAMIGTVRVLDVLGGSYYTLPMIAGLGAGALAVREVAKLSSGHYDNVRSQLDTQVEIAKSTGEDLEFHKLEGGKLAVIWYRHTKLKAAASQDITQRATKIAEIIKATEAEEVLVNKDIAELLKLTGQSTTETEWLYKTRRVKTQGDKPSANLVQTTAEKFLDQLKVASKLAEVEKDDTLLNACVQYILSQPEDDTLKRILKGGVDTNSGNQLSQIVLALSRKVQVYLEGIGFELDRQTGLTVAKYQRGQMTKSSKRSAGDPGVRWIVEGQFVGTESLLKFAGQTHEELKAIFETTASKREKLRAATMLGYIEAVKAQNGLNFVPTNNPKQERDRPIPYTRRLKRWKNNVDPKYQVYPVERGPKRAARIGALCLAGIVVYNGAMNLAEENRGVLAYKPVATQIDNAISVPVRAFGELIDAPEWVSVRNINTRSVVDESTTLSYGNFQLGPNKPVWYIESFNDADSSGYWMRNMSYDISLSNEWHSWSSAHDSNSQPLTNNGSTMEGVDFKVTRRVDTGTLYSSQKLYLPIKYRTKFIGATVGVEGSDVKIVPTVYKQSDGSVYIDLVEDIFNEAKDINKNFVVEYTLADDGNDGVGQTTKETGRKSRILPPGQDWRDLDSASLRAHWASVLGKDDYTDQDISDYLRAKDYSLKPVVKNEFENETELAQAYTESPYGNCNTGNTALYSSNPENLGFASGYLNSNKKGETEVLSLAENHGFNFDTAGNILDATPANPTNEVNDYKEENFEYGSEEASGDDLPTPMKIFFGGLMAASFGGLFAQSEYFRRMNAAEKNRKKLTEAEARELWDIATQMLYAPSGNKFVAGLSQSKSHEEVKKDLETLTHSKGSTTLKDRRAIKMYGKEHPEVNPESIKLLKKIWR